MTASSRLLVAAMLMGWAAMAGSVAGEQALGVAPQAASSAATVWSGVYTAAQAKRGERVYKAECGRCHGSDVHVSSSPVFVGSDFFTRWRDRSVGEIFMYIKVNMPRDAPDSLTDSEYIDIVAHLLHENQIPAGHAELPPAFDLLSHLMLTDNPGPSASASQCVSATPRPFTP